MRAVCVLLAVAVARAQLPADPPAFSWDVIPRFFHAANDTRWDQKTVHAAASLPLVTIEKTQSISEPPVGHGAEGKIVAQLQAVKEANATTRALVYINTMIAFPQYDFVGEMNSSCASSCFVHNTDGSTCLFPRMQLPLFDLANEDAANKWLDAARGVLSHSWIDGVFADRGRATASVDLKHCDMTDSHRAAWDKGHIRMMQRLMNMTKELCGGRGIVLPNGADVPGVNARMFEDARPNDTNASPPGDDIDLIMADVGKRVVEVHEDHVEPGTGPASPRSFNTSLAAFLVAAGEFTYFQATETWATNSWVLPRTEFGLRLGAPKGRATKAALRPGLEAWKRTFGDGVEVYLDATTWEHPCVLWPQGPASLTTADGREWGYVTGRVADCNIYLSQG